MTVPCQVDAIARDSRDTLPVMPGLGPGIHAFPPLRFQDVDGRN
jgi:hypothetical protein